MAAEPGVWILSGGRQGDLDQMLALVHALDWPAEVKTLRFRGPSHPLLAARRVVNPPGPPWPRLALCAEAMTSVIARDIKRRSGGRTRIVCLGRPAGATRHFDLVLTTAQYRLPPASNVVELSMPLSSAAAAAQADASDGPVALIVGGPAFPDRLDGKVAEELARRALAHASGKARLLDAHTSPRTPADAVAALRRIIVPPHRLSLFAPGESRYRSALAEASEIIVTSDSVSMLADALAASRPVSVYPLPQDTGLRLSVGNWLHRNAVADERAAFAPVRWLFDAGLIEAAADRRRLIDRLVSEARVSWFGNATTPPRMNAADDDLATACARLRTLMGP